MVVADSTLDGLSRTRMGPYWLEPVLEITRVRDLTPGVDSVEKS